MDNMHAVLLSRRTESLELSRNPAMQTAPANILPMKEDQLETLLTLAMDNMHAVILPRSMEILE